MQKLKNNHLFWLMLTGVGIFLANLDAMYVNIMEARNFITAREMVEDGNWILTTLNGEPRYQKPPLPTWLTALSGMLLGMKNMFALRLPAALLALVTLLFTYRLGQRITSHKKYPLYAGLVLATSFYIVFSGRNGQWDIFTHGFMMGCIYFLYRFFTDASHIYRNALVAALFFGASFMSKGPVSMYALLLPFLIAYGVVYRFKAFKKRWVPLLIFLVVSLLLSSWWHWYTYTFDGEAVAEITRRETANWTGYNTRPFYYYWSFFTQSGIWTLPAFVGLLYPYLRKRVSDPKAYRFTFFWTMASVVLLSIIPEKKSRYLLPVLIPMAMNTAFYIEYLIRRFAALKDKKETIPVYFNFGLIACIGLAFPIGGYIFLQDQISEVWVWYGLLSIALGTIGFLMMRNLIRRQMERVFYLTIGFVVAIMCLGMPMASVFSTNSEYKSLALLNDWQAETRLPVYEFGGFTPEMIWDYGKPIKVLSQDDTVLIPEGDRFGVLIAEENLEKFETTFDGYTLTKVTRYDMNPKAPGERSHRPRLWRDLYLVEKN